MGKGSTTPSPNGGGNRYGAIQGRVGGSAADAVQGLEEVIGEAVIACIMAGDAIFFGSTRDHSAVCLRVYSESGNGEWYEGSPVQLDSVLRAVKDAAIGS